MFSKTFHGTTKKEKRSKKESLWKLPQPWKSQKVAFGDVFLMISTAAWISLRKKRSGFSTVTTGSTTINYSTINPRAIVI